jgi:hypothetical protein
MMHDVSGQEVVGMRPIDHRVDELFREGHGRCRVSHTLSIYAGSGRAHLLVEEDPGEPWTVT